MNICEFSVEIKNNNKHKSSINDIIYEAFCCVHGGSAVYDSLIKSSHDSMGKVFKDYYTINRIKAYRSIRNSKYFVVVETANRAVDHITAQIVFVTKENVSCILEECQKDLKRILKRQGLIAEFEFDEIKLFLTDGDDLKKTDIGIKASYSKTEQFERKDWIYIIVSGLVILVCVGLAFTHWNESESQNIVSNSIAVSISLFISVLTSSLIKVYNKKSIRIDDFQQWIVSIDMNKKLIQTLVDTDQFQTPETEESK